MIQETTNKISELAKSLSKQTEAADKALSEMSTAFTRINDRVSLAIKNAIDALDALENRKERLT